MVEGVVESGVGEVKRKTSWNALVTAMEWGYRACEKGWNLQRAIKEFRRIVSGQ